MQTHIKRPPSRITWARGSKRSIRPDRARDEDLHIFLRLSKDSLRITARDLRELIRPV